VDDIAAADDQDVLVPQGLELSSQIIKEPPGWKNATSALEG